ncbi:MAG: DUF1343 domain-containing protein [Planctomycetia bacterium]
MSGIRIGLEVLSEGIPAVLQNRRLGLLMNQASVDWQLRYSCDVVAAACPGQLMRLFSPQHGFWGEQQANMIESRDQWYEPLDLPVHSLYSATRRPTSEQLCDIDVLLIDLQDVGTRVYTFIWTVVECLRACAEAGVAVVILDRPNPLGGLVSEGPCIRAGYESFVGGAAIPMRHGLTMAELATLLNQELGLGALLTVLPMRGWRRSMHWPDLDRHWVPQSPNMPRWETAIVYPGQVLLEGTTLSEGRGTTRPFEFCGAPGIVPERLVAALAGGNAEGLILQPVRFRPTFDKWMHETCGGISLHIQKPAVVRSFRFTVALLAAVRQLNPDVLQFTGPPYEYEYVRPPIDILFGSSELRAAFCQPEPLAGELVDELCRHDRNEWACRIAGFLQPEYA